MMKSKEEQYGQLALTNILASVWLGDWDRYEAIFKQMDVEMTESFPFHSNYERENVALWHENHFSIPGDYFIPPYFSSYKRKNVIEEDRRKELLCLIGSYEKMGFYFPLHQAMYPDHLGCLTSFIGAIQQEKIKAINSKDEELFQQLDKLEMETVRDYVLPVLEGMNGNALKQMKHPFFSEFIPFHYEMLLEEYNSN